MASDAAKNRMTTLTRIGDTESVIYRPAAGGATTISAVVDRGPHEPVMNGIAPRLVVMVLNDADDGIDAASLDVGADMCDVAERIGGSAVSRGIQLIISQDPDWLKLAIV